MKKRMAPLQMLLCLLLLHMDNAMKSRDSQRYMDAHTVKTSFQLVTAGETVILNCTYKNDILGKLYWFKQSLENTLSMVSTYFDKTEFYNSFNNNDRFKLDYKDGKNNLEIANVHISDSAVYHCVSSVAHQIQFLATVYVTVKNVNHGLRIEQTAPETVEPGHSLFLNCSVQMESCDGHHRVHWFKQSEGSAAGVLYSHGGSSDQCESNIRDSPTNSCVYTHTIHNVSSEQTGTYYCAVAACGQVLFGNGTAINIKVDRVVYILAGALVFTTVLVLLLVFSLYIMIKTYKLQNTEPDSEDSGPLSTTGNTENEPDHLNYAALSVNKKPRRQRNTDEVNCVYSSVR